MHCCRLAQARAAERRALSVRSFQTRFFQGRYGNLDAMVRERKNERYLGFRL